MRTYITQPELEQGWLSAKFSPDRKDKINWLIHLGQPLCLSTPQQLNGSPCCCVMPLGIEPIKDSLKERLNFIPIICRTMTIGKLREGRLAKVVLEIDGQQWMFSGQEQQRTTFRFSGNGVDPDVAEHSWLQLADLIQSDNDHPAMMRLYGWLKEHFNPKETPCLV